MSTFLDLLDGVKAYYGSGSDEWSRIATGGVTAETLPIIQQVPGVSITRSASGKVLGYDYANPFAGAGSAASIIDSNVDTGSYGLTSFTANVPATATTDSQTGLTTLSSGARSSATGSVISTVADKISLGMAGVALGTKLGVAIDSALYSVNPSWWDENFPSINPETWSDIFPDNAAGNVARALFGIGDDAATMYLDARVLAYGYLAMLKNGAFVDGEGQADYDDLSGMDSWAYIRDIIVPFKLSTLVAAKRPSTMHEYSSTSPYSMGIVAPVSRSYPIANTYSDMFIAAGYTNDFYFTYTDTDPATGKWTQYRYNPVQVTANGHTYYYCYASYHYGYGNREKPELLTDTWNDWPDMPDSTGSSTRIGGAAAIAYIMLYGVAEMKHPGIDENPNATITIDPDAVINPKTGAAVTPEDDPADVLTALQTAYPALFADTIYEDIPQDDGTTERVVYVPVPWPNSDEEGNPVTDLTPGIDPQTEPEVSPETRPDAAQELTDDVTTPTDPPNTGEGESPPAIIPTGSASALYSIYNPTQAELSSFGAWLWSTNFVDQLLKLFSDPMQAIIGLHKVFCIPDISGRGNIKVGYLDSGVQTNLVSGQYVTINCGTVTLREYFGSVMDYDPYTRVQIYLPFVGIMPLDVGDVMRGSITVTYHIDVLTGACLAEVSVTRDGSGGILYTYTGNAAVQYPISSGSYMGILSSLVSVAGGVAGTVASGGALAPLAMGAASGVLSARTRVQHSGGFSGNAGAMGVRKPYLIITRPQAALASSFESFEGMPANHTARLGQCSGFVRAKAVHLEGVPATLAELNELESMLAEGIII